MAKKLPYGFLEKRLESKFYYWRFVDKIDGRQRKKSTSESAYKAAFEKAEKWALEYLAQSQNNDLEPEPFRLTEGIRFADVCKDFLKNRAYSVKAGKQSESWWETQSLHVKVRIIPFFGNDTDPRGIKTRHIRHFSNELLGEGLNPKTINHVLTVLNQILKFAASNEYIDSVPYFERLRTDRTKKGKIVDDEATTYLFRAGRLISPDAVRFVALGRYSGLRLGETLSLEWSDIDFDEGCIRLKKQKNKTTMPAPLLKAREYLDECDPSERVGPVVGYSHNNQPRRPTKQYRKTWKSIKAKANALWRVDNGIAETDENADKWIVDPSLRYHDLRHTFATELANSKQFAPAELAMLTRHSTLEALSIYQHAAYQPVFARAGSIDQGGESPKGEGLRRVK